MRSLQNAQQYRRPDRANGGNLTKPFPGFVLLTLREQISSYFLAQPSQRIELLVIKFRPPAHPRFGDFLEPFLAMATCINLLASTRDGPTAINGFPVALQAAKT